jgi:hypothetical protein
MEFSIYQSTLKRLVRKNSHGVFDGKAKIQRLRAELNNLRGEYKIWDGLTDKKSPQAVELRKELKNKMGLIVAMNVELISHELVSLSVLLGNTSPQRFYEWHGHLDGLFPDPDWVEHDLMELADLEQCWGVEYRSQYKGYRETIKANTVFGFQIFCKIGSVIGVDLAELLNEDYIWLLLNGTNQMEITTATEKDFDDYQSAIIAYSNSIHQVSKEHIYTYLFGLIEEILELAKAMKDGSDELAVLKEMGDVMAYSSIILHLFYVKLSEVAEEPNFCRQGGVDVDSLYTDALRFSAYFKRTSRGDKELDAMTLKTMISELFIGLGDCHVSFYLVMQLNLQKLHDRQNRGTQLGSGDNR